MLLLVMGIYGANLAHNMLNLINSYRSQEGLRPLKSIQNLEGAAKDQALYMCENSALTHENPGGDLQQRARRNGFRGFSIGENIAKNHSDGYEEVGKMWMNSPNHKKNIMGNFTYSGIATCLDKNGSRYWAQVFGGDGQDSYETGPSNGGHMDGSFTSNDEITPENLRDDQDNAIDDQDDLAYSGTRPDSSTEHGNVSRLNNSLRFGSTGLGRIRRGSGMRFPGLSYKSREAAVGEICFNVDGCKPSRTTYPLASAFESKTFSKFTITQVKTSYVPVSSVIYKTLTRTILQSTDISISAFSSSVRPQETQTVFMIINASVPAQLSTTVASEIPKNESPDATKPAQTSVTTVTITSSGVDPGPIRKTVTVTESPEPREITVTVTSRSPHSTSVTSVEKTIAIVSNLPSSEKTITVVGQNSPVQFPRGANQSEDLVSNRIRLKLIHALPDLESDNDSGYSPKKAYDGYGESWTEPKIAIYGPVESLPLKRSSSQEYSFPQRRLRSGNRFQLKQENQYDDPSAEMPKYPRSIRPGRQYLSTYYISDHETLGDSPQPSSENRPQYRTQYLSNPCGNQDNPCIKTVFVHG